MKSNLLIIIVLLLSLFCCKSNDDDTVMSTCDAIIFNSGLFDNGTTDEFEILEASIANDCLVVLLPYGGGCGEIDAKLVLDDVKNSNVLNRSAKLYL